MKLELHTVVTRHREALVGRHPYSPLGGGRVVVVVLLVQHRIPPRSVLGTDIEQCLCPAARDNRRLLQQRGDAFKPLLCLHCRLLLQSVVRLLGPRRVHSHGRSVDLFGQSVEEKQKKEVQAALPTGYISAISSNDQSSRSFSSSSPPCFFAGLSRNTPANSGKFSLVVAAVKGFSL